MKCFDDTSDNWNFPVEQAVLPLVQETGGKLSGLGTGFIINPSGLFITATHVLEEAQKHVIRRVDERGKAYDEYRVFGLCLPENPSSENETSPILRFEFGYSNGNRVPDDGIRRYFDLAYGWLNARNCLPLYPFCIRPAMPKVGARIAAVGYYEMEGAVEFYDDKPIALNYRHKTAVSVGKVTRVFYDRHPELSFNFFPCFETDAEIQPGMSGGPIIDESGNVCGITCFGGDFLPAVCAAIWPIFSSPIRDRTSAGPVRPTDRTLYDLAKDGSILVDDTIDRLTLKTNLPDRRTVSYRLSDDERCPG